MQCVVNAGITIQLRTLLKGEFEGERRSPSTNRADARKRPGTLARAARRDVPFHKKSGSKRTHFRHSRKCMGPGLWPGAGCRGCGTPCQGHGDRVLVLHRIMQIRPLQPSLMMRSMVSRTLPRASVGIRYSLLCSPSLTSSCSDLPKIFDSQISDGL